MLLSYFLQCCFPIYTFNLAFSSLFAECYRDTFYSVVLLLTYLTSHSHDYPQIVTVILSTVLFCCLHTKLRILIFICRMLPWSFLQCCFAAYILNFEFSWLSADCYCDPFYSVVLLLTRLTSHSHHYSQIVTVILSTVLFCCSHTYLRILIIICRMLLWSFLQCCFAAYILNFELSFLFADCYCDTFYSVVLLHTYLTANSHDYPQIATVILSTVLFCCLNT